MKLHMKSLIAAAVFSVAGVLSASAFAASVTAQVDLAHQRMYVSVDGHPKYVWPISTGMEGFETPTGLYRPIRLDRDHASSEYEDAPMPFSIFFTGGYAIHGTPVVSKLGDPVSHGCVRLSKTNAHALWDLVLAAGPDNTTIAVVP